jgi:hypothetical protein
MQASHPKRHFGLASLLMPNTLPNIIFQCTGFRTICLKSVSSATLSWLRLTQNLTNQDPERVKYHSHGCNPWLKKNYLSGFGAHFCFFAKIVTKPQMLKRFLIDYFGTVTK